MDEDAPPPLQSLAAQVQALQPAALGSAVTEAGAGGAVDEDGMHVAATTLIGDVRPRAAPAASTAAPALKRGFFDAKPTKRSSRDTQRSSSTAKASTSGKDAIPLIKAKPSAGIADGPNIPDFMKLQPSEHERQYEQYKSSLVEALKPTPDMVAKVSSNADLMAGFDDPEVMAAVSEVAKDPNAMRKYANNAKVKAFYAAMGNMMGDKVQSVAQQHSKQPQMSQPSGQCHPQPRQQILGT